MRFLPMNSSGIDNSRVAVVIPVYNHAGKVAGVIAEARKLPWPLIVVDDGSTDGTYDRIKDIPSITLVRHDRNRGKGAAILTGFAAAAPRADWAVTMDADLQDPPELIPELVAAWRAGAEVVLAVRRSRQETGLRRVGFDPVSYTHLTLPTILRV